MFVGQLLPVIQNLEILELSIIRNTSESLNGIAQGFKKVSDHWMSQIRKLDLSCNKELGGGLKTHLLRGPH